MADEENVVIDVVEEAPAEQAAAEEGPTDEEVAEEAAESAE